MFATKSIFLTSVEKIDFFKTFTRWYPYKIKKRFVGKIDGIELELRVIYRWDNFLDSPILRGKIENFDSYKTIVHFTYDYSIISLLIIILGAAFISPLIYQLIQSKQYSVLFTGTIIALSLVIHQLYNFRRKKKELKNFIIKIFYEYLEQEEN